MSNEDDEDVAGELDPADLETRLDDAEGALESAETEADLDTIEETLDGIETDIHAADLPESDDDEDDPTELMAGRLSDLRDTLDERRGPYVADVARIVEEAATTLRDSEWTENGESDAIAAAETLGDELDAVLEDDVSVETASVGDTADSLDSASQTVSEADLNPDEDSERIAELLEAAETLTDALDASEVWEDLTVREQLDADGFYDVLNPENRKDFPAEWNAIKIHKKQREVEPMLTALDRFESDFMEENALDALEQIAPAEAFEDLHQRAQKRAVQPIRILGRIGDDRACETLHEFLGGGDVNLEKTTLRALGAIGSEESTQSVANRLVADNPEIRSLAARSLGLIGDTRAIDPLKRVLEEDDADEVRASAAWALNQIGTERALEAAGAYADDRSYIVQVEAEQATGI